MQHNILLVDDEAGIIHAIRRMLRSEPFTIYEAGNADEALAVIARHDIDLMVTDFKMPGMTGLELCRKVRKQSPTTYRLLLSGVWLADRHAGMAVCIRSWRLIAGGLWGALAVVR